MTVVVLFLDIISDFLRYVILAFLPPVRIVGFRLFLDRRRVDMGDAAISVGGCYLGPAQFSSHPILNVSPLISGKTIHLGLAQLNMPNFEKVLPVSSQKLR